MARKRSWTEERNNHFGRLRQHSLYVAVAAVVVCCRWSDRLKSSRTVFSAQSLLVGVAKMIVVWRKRLDSRLARS